MGVINVYKPIGATPLEIVNAIKNKFPKYKNTKIAYAGRLDPMAHGVLLLLVEPETKNRTKYQNLDKEYEFEVLFGITTDTYDLMGISIRTRTVPVRSSHNDIDKAELNKVIPIFLRMSELQYPPYSSKTVDGKPLYWYARNDKLDTINIPAKKITIHSFDLLSLKSLSTEALKKKVKVINKVQGDFRQKKILEAWSKLFAKHPDQSYQVAKFHIHCTSGTYVRSIVHKMGKDLGCGALAFDIKRTAVGKYKIDNALRLFISFPSPVSLSSPVQQSLAESPHSA